MAFGRRRLSSGHCSFSPDFVDMLLKLMPSGHRLGGLEADAGPVLPRPDGGHYCARQSAMGYMYVNRGGVAQREGARRGRKGESLGDEGSLMAMFEMHFRVTATHGPASTQRLGLLDS